MTPDMVREEQDAARNADKGRPVPPPPAGVYRPWDEADRPEPHEVDR